MMHAVHMLEMIDSAVCALNGPDSVAWTEAYIDHFGGGAELVRTLAFDACKLGNGPHNQEMQQGMLEDFGNSRAAGRDRILLAYAQLLSAHRKYGDPLEASRRFQEAMAH